MSIDASGHVWKPFVRSAAIEVDTIFSRPDDTGTYIGHGEIYPAKRESNVGQYAVDFMISSRAMGDRIADYLIKNAARLGVRYIIWWKRIWSRTNLPSRWREYTNPVASRRGTKSGDHYNHVHASFFSNGKYFPLSTPSLPKPLSLTYYAKIKTTGYKIKNGVGIANKIVKPGYKIVGKIKKRSDGYYLVTRFGNWYPLDDLTKVRPIES